MCEAASTTDPTLDNLKKELDNGLFFIEKKVVVKGVYGETKVYDPRWTVWNGVHSTAIELLHESGLYGKIFFSKDGASMGLFFRVPLEDQKGTERSRCIETLARFLTEYNFLFDFITAGKAIPAEFLDRVRNERGEQKETP